MRSSEIGLRGSGEAKNTKPASASGGSFFFGTQFRTSERSPLGSTVAAIGSVAGLRTSEPLLMLVLFLYDEPVTLQGHAGNRASTCSSLLNSLQQNRRRFVLAAFATGFRSGRTQRDAVRGICYSPSSLVLQIPRLSAISSI
jgi:hypothetical protein